jgi:FkbM family methyltransferase
MSSTPSDHPAIHSRRYKLLRHFLRAIEPFVPAQNVKQRYRRMGSLYRLLGGAETVRARRYDGFEIVLPADSFDKILHGADHKRFGWSNFYPLLYRHVRPGSCVVDIGAGTGDEVLDLTQLVGPAGTIFAYEPNAKSYGVLVETLALNKISNAKAFNAAVGKVDGTLDVSGRITAHSARYSDSNATRETVPVRTLDSIARENDLLRNDNVSLLKIDTDGFDLDVISGAGAFFAANPRCKVVMEHLPGMNYSGHKGREVIEFLRAKGFSVNAIQPAAVKIESETDIQNLYKNFDDPRHMIAHDFFLSRD